MRKGINVAIIASLAMAILIFGILGVITAVGGGIQSELKKTQCTGGSAGFNTTTGECLAGSTTLASNITGKAMEGSTNIGNQLPLMATILVFGAIIALLLGVFLWKRGQGGM